MSNVNAVILIVEDEALVALGLASMLEELGHSVCGCVISAPAAVAAVAKRRPDLVFMDIHLANGTDGVAAAQEIRARFGVRSLFTTAQDDPATRARAAAADPVGFIAKPYARETIAAALSCLGCDGTAHPRAAASAVTARRR